MNLRDELDALHDKAMQPRGYEWFPLWQNAVCEAYKQGDLIPADQVRELTEGLDDLFDTLDNSAMLCTSEEFSIRQAFEFPPTCQVCGFRKVPIGRSHAELQGGCTDECAGYRQHPYPSSLFDKEKSDIRALVAISLAIARKLALRERMER